MRRTPNMEGRAEDITDTHQLYERIGYRIWLAWRKGGDEGQALAGFYASYNKRDSERILELTEKRGE